MSTEELEDKIEKTEILYNAMVVAVQQANKEVIRLQQLAESYQSAWSNAANIIYCREWRHPTPEAYLEKHRGFLNTLPLKKEDKTTQP